MRRLALVLVVCVVGGAGCGRDGGSTALCRQAAHPWEVTGFRASGASGDGLPESGTATVEAAEATLGTNRADLQARYSGDSATVRTEPGAGWKRSDDGRVTVAAEDIAVIRIVLRAGAPCPASPTIYRAIPLRFERPS